MQGSNLAVWNAIVIGLDPEMDAEKAADYFHRHAGRAKAAFRYHEAYPEEIDLLTAANRNAGYEKRRRLRPRLRLFEADERRTSLTRSLADEGKTT
jgi:hypothetical protein